MQLILSPAIRHQAVFCVFWGKLLYRQAVNIKSIQLSHSSENITDFKDQVSTAVIANLALSLPCGTFVQTIKSM